MAKLALSGIPSYFQRAIVAHDGNIPVYRDTFGGVQSKADLEFQISLVENTGNYLISEGVRRATATVTDESTYFSFSRLANEEDSDGLIDYINDSYDFFIFSTANIFNISFSPQLEASVLSKIKIPIVLMSAGIQQRESFGNSFPPAFGPLMEVLRRPDVYVFTRGHYTAKFLQKHGVKWAEATGCPSVYAFPHNTAAALLRLKDVDVTSNIKVVHSGYLGSVNDTIVDIEALGADLPVADYVLQDEFAIFDFKLAADCDGRSYDEATGLLLGEVDFPGKQGLVRELNCRIFFNTDQWRSWVSSQDFSFGRRFHGMVMAMQSSVPAIMLSVDDRTKEMLEYIGFPHLEALEWNTNYSKVDHLNGFLKSLDLNWHFDRYQVCRERFGSLVHGLGLH